MIGRMIDRAAVTIVGTTGLYLFFLNAGMGVLPSCVLTFICAVLLRYLLRNRPWRRRITALQAEAALMTIAIMGTEEALEALRTLTGRTDGLFLLRHPEGRLTLNEMYGLWREKGDGTAVAVTCVVEDAAAEFAKSRGMELIDKKALLKRIRRTGLYVPENAPGESVKGRLKGLWNVLRTRPLRPRMIVYAAGLLGMYIATGNAICMLCGLGLAGLAGAKVIQKYA